MTPLARMVDAEAELPTRCFASVFAQFIEGPVDTVSVRLRSLVEAEPESKAVQSLLSLGWADARTVAQITGVKERGNKRR